MVSRRTTATILGVVLAAALSLSLALSGAAAFADGTGPTVSPDDELVEYLRQILGTHVPAPAPPSPAPDPAASAPGAGDDLGPAVAAPATAAAEPVSIAPAAAGSAAAGLGDHTVHAATGPARTERSTAFGLLELVEGTIGTGNRRAAAPLGTRSPASRAPAPIATAALALAVVAFLVFQRRPDRRDARLVAVGGIEEVARFR